MVTFRIEDTLACSAARFWALFFDPALNSRLYREELGFPAFDVVEQADSDAGLRRVITAVPRLEAAPMLRRLLGPTFRYREEGSFDRRAGRYTYQLIPSALGSRLRSEGVVHLLGGPERPVVRVAEITLDVRLGAMTAPVEALIRRTTEQGYRRFAAAINRHLASDDAAALAAVSGGGGQPSPGVTAAPAVVGA